MSKARSVFLHSVLSLTAWGACTGAWANASPLLATGSASFSDFSYQLNSLAPTSGTTPWIIFGAPPQSGWQQGVMETFGQVNPNMNTMEGYAPNADYVRYDGLLPPTAINTASKDGMAIGSASPAAISVGIRVNADALNGMLPTADGTGNSFLTVTSHIYTGSASANNYVEDVSYLPGGGVGLVLGSPAATSYDFTLSPHTELVLRGRLATSLEIHPELLPESITSSANNQFQPNAAVSLGFAEPQYPLQTQYDSYAAYAADAKRSFGQSLQGSYGYWSTAPGYLNKQSDEQFVTFRLVNDSDQAKTGALAIQVSAVLNLTQLPASAVPEPERYALMGIGLLGMFWVRRRQS